MADTTTVRMSYELKDEIESLGTKKDSFEDIIKRLLEEHKKRAREIHEAVVDEWGKAMISRTRKGEKILYSFKPKN